MTACSAGSSGHNGRGAGGQQPPVAGPPALWAQHPQELRSGEEVHGGTHPAGDPAGGGDPGGGRW